MASDDMDKSKGSTAIYLDYAKLLEENHNLRIQVYELEIKLNKLQR